MTDSSGAAFDPRALAAHLYSLQQSGKKAPTADFALPADLRHAMDAQNFLAAEEGIATNAWKVAMSPDGQPVTAPLHPYVEASSGAVIPWEPGLKFEAEIAVRLGRDIPVGSGTQYTRTELAEVISDAYLGAELLSSSIEESGKISFPLYLADRIGNRGYVLGPALPKSIIDTIGNTPLTVSLDGQSIFDGPAQHPVGDILTWLVAYANDRQRPDTSLKAGALITTGTLCGAIELASPGTIEIVLGGTARLQLSLAAK